MLEILCVNRSIKGGKIATLYRYFEPNQCDGKLETYKKIENKE